VLVRDMGPNVVHSAEAISEHLSRRLSLWESFLLCLWSNCLLCRNTAIQLSVWAGGQFLESINATPSEHQGETEMTGHPGGAESSRGAESLGEAKDPLPHAALWMQSQVRSVCV
jgi:hypothetical protein